jgi:hypothetical protein
MTPTNRISMYYRNTAVLPPRWEPPEPEPRPIAFLMMVAAVCGFAAGLVVAGLMR